MCGLIVYFNFCLRIYDSRGTLLTPRELGITRFRHCGSSRGSQSAESPADERETGQTGRPGSFPNCPQEGGNGERNANESVGEGGGGGGRARARKMLSDLYLNHLRMGFPWRGGQAPAPGPTPLILGISAVVVILPAPD